MQTYTWLGLSVQPQLILGRLAKEELKTFPLVLDQWLVDEYDGLQE